MSTHDRDILTAAAIFVFLAFLVLLLGSCAKKAPVHTPLKTVATETYAWEEEKDGTVTLWVHGQGGLAKAKEEICIKRKGPCTIETAGQIYYIRFPEETNGSTH